MRPAPPAATAGTSMPRSMRSSSGPETRAAVARDPVGRAVAAPARVAEPAAGARIHRRDELELRRESALPRRARDVDDARLERLAQHLQHAPIPFRQLVQKQHAVMRERDLAGPRIAAAADQRDGARRVMRRAIRAHAPGRRTRSARRAKRSRRLQRFVLGRAAAGCPAAAARASTCPCPAARSSAAGAPPAAAISSARLACAWPRTSARSGDRRARVTRGAGVNGSSRIAPGRCAQTASSVAAGCTTASRTSAASSALAAGSTNARPSRRAASAIASAPRIGRNSPSSASSPANSCRASASPGTAPSRRECRAQSADRSGRIPSADRRAPG